MPLAKAWREDVLTDQKETFNYDELNRLTEIKYYLDGIMNLGESMQIIYNNDGNITSKTIVGIAINYGTGTAGPHAITDIEFPAVKFESPPQNISYTSFNKVSTI